MHSNSTVRVSMKIAFSGIFPIHHEIQSKSFYSNFNSFGFCSLETIFNSVKWMEIYAFSFNHLLSACPTLSIFYIIIIDRNAEYTIKFLNHNVDSYNNPRVVSNDFIYSAMLKDMAEKYIGKKIWNQFYWKIQIQKLLSSLWCKKHSNRIRWLEIQSKPSCMKAIWHGIRWNLYALHTNHIARALTRLHIHTSTAQITLRFWVSGIKRGMHLFSAPLKTNPIANCSKLTFTWQPKIHFPVGAVVSSIQKCHVNICNTFDVSRIINENLLFGSLLCLPLSLGFALSFLLSFCLNGVYFTWSVCERQARNAYESPTTLAIWIK